MKLYWCYDSTNDEWGCYVIAPTPSKAKVLFHKWYGDVDYTDVRCNQCMKLPEGLDLHPQVLDDPDDPLLKELGVKYSEVKI